MSQYASVTIKQGVQILLKPRTFCLKAPDEKFSDLLTKALMYCQQPKDIEGEPAVHVLNKGADPITCDMEDPALIVTNTFDGAV